MSHRVASPQATSGEGSMSAATPRDVVLVELTASDLGGHWLGALAGLARAALGSGARVRVITGTPLHRDAARDLARHGVAVGTAQARGATGRALAVAARVLDRLSALARSPQGALRWWAASRAAREALALRCARGQVRSSTAVILLSAGECLPCFVDALGGVSHVRIVHEVSVQNGLLFRSLDVAGRRLRRNAPGPIHVAPTGGVARQLRARFPHLPLIVRPFAMAEPADYITEAERAEARRNLGIEEGVSVALLLGGWWPAKNMATVVEALGHVTAPLHIVIAGAPLDGHLLAQIPSDLVTTIVQRQVSEDERRQLYAACDFTIVSRHPGVVKESGLLMDAAKYGVAAVVSDHEPTLCAQLHDRPWARLFKAGDPHDLSAALSEVAVTPLPRPHRAEASCLGMVTHREALTALVEIATTGGIAAKA